MGLPQLVHLDERWLGQCDLLRMAAKHYKILYYFNARFVVKYFGSTSKSHIKRHPSARFFSARSSSLLPKHSCSQKNYSAHQPAAFAQLLHHCLKRWDLSLDHPHGAHVHSPL